MGRFCGVQICPAAVLPIYMVRRSRSRSLAMLRLHPVPILQAAKAGQSSRCRRSSPNAGRLEALGSKCESPFKPSGFGPFGRRRGRFWKASAQLSMSLGVCGAFSCKAEILLEQIFKGSPHDLFETAR